jgi:hypothetical protein
MLLKKIFYWWFYYENRPYRIRYRWNWMKVRIIRRSSYLLMYIFMIRWQIYSSDIFFVIFTNYVLEDSFSCIREHSSQTACRIAWIHEAISMSTSAKRIPLLKNVSLAPEPELSLWGSWPLLLLYDSPVLKLWGIFTKKDSFWKGRVNVDEF